METIQIDKAGRVALPKPLRKQFNLVPGDKLRASVEGNSIKLERAYTGGTLVHKGNVLVFSGEFSEPITTGKVEELIAEERENRVGVAARKLRRK